MKISSETEKENWNKFLIENQAGFLQSFEWGQFQEKNKKKVWRFKIERKKEILAQAQIIKEVFCFKKSFTLPFCHFYIPFGPIFKKGLCSAEKETSLNLIFKQIKALAKKESAVFLRIEPQSPLPQKPILSDSPKRVQPQKTLILGLEKSEQELLKNFHFRTRYNIKLAQKKGVKLRLVDNQTRDIGKYSEVFYNLLSKTAKKQGFSIYPKTYYQNLLDINTEYFQSKLFLAEYENKIISANIVVFFNQRASHVHGCSDYRYRFLKAANFLQWQQILEAKTKKCKDYDFWGINEQKYPGVSSFKKGFNGKEFEYPKGKDLIFNENWYKLYNLFRKTKRAVQRM